MHTIVFIPGIMGSQLKLKQADGSFRHVWPPTPWETWNGYRRITELADPKVEVDGIILTVAGGCYKVYQPLIDDLKHCIDQNPGQRRLVQFAYDWRQDLFDTARLLTDELIAIAETSTKITLIGHSMGGLICRLVLENPTHKNLPWHRKIGQFLALAVPHRGAPLALARALGLDTALGISATDFQKLAADTRYPSGYQLLPWRGDPVMWNQTSTAPVPLAPIDFYDPHQAASLKLNATNLTRALALQQALSAPGTPPAHVRYVGFSGTRYATVDRVDQVSPNAPNKITVANGGDGTVPSWSSLLINSQHQYAGTDHQNIFTDDELRKTLYRLLDTTWPFETHGIGATPAEVRLHLPNPVVRITDGAINIRIILLPSTDTVTGNVILEADTATTADTTATPAFTNTIAVYPVSYSGPDVESLAISIPMPPMTGLFQLRFGGTQAIPAIPAIPADSDPLLFAVQN